MIQCGNRQCPNNNADKCSATGELILDKRGRCIIAGERDADGIKQILEFLSRFASYPLDEDKDSEFFYEILQDFPGVDVLEQLKRFQAWILDLEEERKMNYRSTIRRWMKRVHDKKTKTKNKNIRSDEYRSEGNNVLENVKTCDDNPW